MSDHIGIRDTAREALAQPDKRDRFEFEESDGGYHFPCGICIYRHQPAQNETCRACCYFCQ